MYLEIENLLNEKFPSDLKHILDGCGFDTELSLVAIDDAVIADIEKHVNIGTEILENTSYENVNPFKFKPGHRVFLSKLPNQIKISRETRAEKPREQLLLTETNGFSSILKAFIDTAVANFGKHPKGYRYNEKNRYFSTFIYLPCGRGCYETLSANLPIPSSNAIRKTKKHVFMIDAIIEKYFQLVTLVRASQESLKGNCVVSS